MKNIPIIVTIAGAVYFGTLAFLNAQLIYTGASMSVTTIALTNDKPALGLAINAGALALMIAAFISLRRTT